MIQRSNLRSRLIVMALLVLFCKALWGLVAVDRQMEKRYHYADLSNKRISSNRDIIAKQLGESRTLPQSGDYVVTVRP